MPSYVIAHDVGTSSVKAALIHRSGTVAATAEEPYPIHQPRPGWVEQDPEDYWRGVVATTRRVIEQSGIAPDDIFGLVFTTQSMGIIPVDAKGKVLHPNITWVDGRAQDQARWMMRLFGGKALFKRLVGIEITGKDVLPKLIWLRQERPTTSTARHTRSWTSTVTCVIAQPAAWPSNGPAPAPIPSTSRRRTGTASTSK